MTRTFMLKDVAEVLGGGTPSTKEQSHWNGGIPWITPRDLSSHHEVYISKGDRNITRLGLYSSSAKLLPEGAVIFSSRAPIGYVTIASKPMTTNQGCKGIICNNELLDNRFLYYWLRLNKGKIESLAGGSTFKEISSTGMRNLSIELPGIKSQKKIADILGTIDEKIELNRKMNETLEQMGQALFRHYFIDNREAREWEDGQFDDLFDVTMGQSPPGSSYNEDGDGVTFYQGRAEFGARFPKKRLSTVDPKRLAKAGDTLLSVRAPVGDINQATEDCCVGRGLAAISSKTGHASFCYYSCKNLQTKFSEYNSEGTVFGAINGKQLKSFKVKLPAANAVNEFEEQVIKLDEQILNNSQQIQNLTTLREALLPRLINGKVKT